MGGITLQEYTLNFKYGFVSFLLVTYQNFFLNICCVASLQKFQPKQGCSQGIRILYHILNVCVESKPKKHLCDQNEGGITFFEYFQKKTSFYFFFDLSKINLENFFCLNKNVLRKIFTLYIWSINHNHRWRMCTYKVLNCS